jgi:hypothetical protein
VVGRSGASRILRRTHSCRSRAPTVLLPEEEEKEAITPPPPQQRVGYIHIHTHRHMNELARARIWMIRMPRLSWAPTHPRTHARTHPSSSQDLLRVINIGTGIAKHRQLSVNPEF